MSSARLMPRPFVRKAPGAVLPVPVQEALVREKAADFLKRKAADRERVRRNERIRNAVIGFIAVAACFLLVMVAR
jgi:hypothetical protein